MKPKIPKFTRAEAQKYVTEFIDHFGELKDIRRALERIGDYLENLVKKGDRKE